uniref:Probable maturase n=1 Tax=Paracoccidioides brasiliensis (strain Pb18) TaxID=502780 RepID=Q1XA93_PARBD|nr:probable maturase [Paracoccidioides brasiliensis]AAY30336.1 probable maturase [Paracoccidioides brasiliensis]
MVQIGEKLNSLSLKENYKISQRYYSTIKEESKLTLTQIKRMFINNNFKTWPENKTLYFIQKDVLQKQMELVSLADIYGLQSEKVYKKQLLLVNSLFFRIIAIDKLFNSVFYKTYLSYPKEEEKVKVELVEKLKIILKNPNLYISNPIKYLWIFNNNKQKLLNITTLYVIGLQHLINLVLEPLVEKTGELHSFGFRPNKSAKNALGYLNSNLLKQDSRWILNTEIKGFFDKINQKWILNNLFLHPDLIKFIKSWFNSGRIDKEVFFETEMGISPGGVLSPTLVNFTLNGLENLLMNSLIPLTNIKQQQLFNYSSQFTSNLVYIRYLDNLVILIRSKYIFNIYVKPILNKFLELRGLSLCQEKSKLFKLKENSLSLDFLGYTFKSQEKCSNKKHIFYSAKSRGIALYPNKIKVLAFLDNIRNIFIKSQNLNAYTLMKKLNPFLIKWCNYYNLGNSFHSRNTVKNAIYHLIWKWAHNKHKKWGKKLIAKTYLKQSNSRLLNNLKWVFKN